MAFEVRGKEEWEHVKQRTRGRAFQAEAMAWPKARKHITGNGQ